MEPEFFLFRKLMIWVPSIISIAPETSAHPDIRVQVEVRQASQHRRRQGEEEGRALSRYGLDSGSPAVAVDEPFHDAEPARGRSPM